MVAQARVEMKRIAAVVILTLMAGSFAVAADNAVGTIKSIDIFGRQVVLENGAAYPVVRGINLAKFKPGDKVVLETDDRKGTQTIIKLAKGDRIPIMLPTQPTTRGRVP
jgi:hypothetical protein